MKLYIKQKVFSLGQKFDIYDATGKSIYYCHGEIFTFGRKLHIYEMNDNEVAYIKQQVFRFRPHYDILIDGNLETTLIKKLTFFVHNYYYDNLPYHIDGEFLAHSYRVLDEYDNILMTVEKKWFTWGDTYEIDIIDESQFILMLASAIVIDCVCHEGKGH